VVKPTGKIDDGGINIAIDIAIGEDRGRVVLMWHKPATSVTLEPQNAFVLAENLARAAHAARFPGEKLPDTGYLAAQIRAKVTEELRDRLVARAAMMLHSARQSPKSDGQIALEIVDQLLAAVS